MTRGCRADEGVTVIVGAVLLTGILLGILVTIQMGFVPIWEENAEAEHMATLTGQLAGLQSELDRQVENRTRVAVATPLQLGRASSSVFGGGVDPAKLSTAPSAAPVELSAHTLRLLETNGTVIDTIDESWTSVSGSSQIGDVGDVVDFRLRIDEIGKGHEGDWITITLTDATGAFAGSFEVEQSKSRSEASIYFTVLDASGSTVLYSNADAIHGANSYGPYWVDLLNADYRFDRVIDAASKPMTITLTEGGYTGEYAITYVEHSTGATVGGGAGVLVHDFTRSWDGGRITLDAQNTYFVRQTMVLENGALVLDQPEGHLFLVRPHFEVAIANNVVQMSVAVPTLKVDQQAVSGQVASVRSHGVAQTSMFGQTPNITMEVTTAYPDLWARMWTEELTAAGLTTSASGCLTDPVGPACHFHVTTTQSTATLVVHGTTPADVDPADPVYDLTVSILQGNVRVGVQGG